MSVPDVTFTGLPTYPASAASLRQFVTPVPMSSSIAAPPENGNVTPPSPTRHIVMSAPREIAPVAEYFFVFIFSVPLPVALIALDPAAPS